jgi:hypothetical protein
MRGCLYVIALALVVLVGGTWLAGPPVTGFVIETGLATGGLRAADLAVDVESEPRWELLTGRADRVRISATDARFHDTRIEQLEIDLRDVTFVDRRAGTIEGRFEGVTIDDGGPADGLTVPVIGLSGGQPIVARLEIDATDAEQLVARGVRERLGREVGTVTLEAPDALTISVDQLSLAGRIAVDADGGLVMTTQGVAGDLLGDVVLVPAGSLPVDLTRVEVRGERLVLDGQLAPGLLG